MSYNQNIISLPGAAEIISALDSDLRLMIVMILRERDAYVHELVTQLGKSQPLISQHLKVLKNAGIVASSRRGREVIYRLIRPGVYDVIALASRVAQLPAQPVDSPFAAYLAQSLPKDR